MFDLQYSKSNSRCTQKALALTQLFKMNKVFSEQKREEFIVCSHKLSIELKLEFFNISDKREWRFYEKNYYLICSL